MSFKRDIQLFETLPAGVSITTPEGFIIDANQALVDILGYKDKEELLNAKSLDFYTNIEDRNKLLLELQKGVVKNFRIKGKQKDGSIVWLSVSTNPIKTENGSLEYIDIVEDITGQVEAQEKIIQFNKIFEKSLNEIYIFDAESLKFLEVNQAAQKNLGYSLDELLNITPLDIKPDYSPDSFNKLVQPLTSGQKEKILFYTRHKRKDNSLYPVEVHLQLSTFQNKPAFTAIILDITERKNAENALKISEEKYKAIIEVQTEFIYRWKPDGTRTFVNKSYAEYYKKSVKELTGTSFVNNINPEAWKKLQKRVNKLSNINPISVNEHVFVIDGETVWKEWTDRAIFDENGNLFEIQSTGRDITRKKLAEQKLIESENGFKQLIEKLPDAIFVTELGGKNKGKIIDVNPAAEFQTGYSREELLAKSIGEDLLENMDDNKFLADENKLIKSGILRLTEKKKRKDGNVYWVEVVITTITLKGKKVALSVNRDISELKKSEHALNESQKNLSLIYDAAGVGLFRIGILPNNKFHILSVNNTYLQITGRKIDKVINHSIEEVLTPESAHVAIEKYTEAINTKSSITWEETSTLPSGKKTGALSITPVFDENNTCTSLIGVVHDISEKKKNEAQIIKSQAELEKRPIRAQLTLTGRERLR